VPVCDVDTVTYRYLIPSHCITLTVHKLHGERLYVLLPVQILSHFSNFGESKFLKFI
jgi:hypothetical protein